MVEPRTSTRRWLPRAVVVGYALLVLVASVRPPPPGSLTPLGPLGLVRVDKWMHAGTYAVFAALLALALRARTRRAVLAAAAVAFAYGVGIELLQGVLPVRALDPADVAANALGALVGGTAWLVVARASRATWR